jgi:hypothetical protein
MAIDLLISNIRVALPDRITGALLRQCGDGKKDCNRSRAAEVAFRSAKVALLSRSERRHSVGNHGKPAGGPRTAAEGLYKIDRRGLACQSVGEIDRVGVNRQGVRPQQRPAREAVCSGL